ncbi:bifunctional methylenetetrahydrofolate dehydrogenase/methenyltetrahydrofolate cyclohydrolase FolD [Hyphomicrobiales bacterium 4NK60-0047b]|jgi:methylenetetrahydrofolate dehydrogenase (NADP+)/methenyltetrahydrofolate cyclohydrolase
MTAQIIDGKLTAKALRASIAGEVAKIKETVGVTPGLAVVLVGADPASEVYVKNKAKQTVEVGMASFEHRLPAETTEDDLLQLIEQLNNDETVHGILVQLPVPDHIDESKVISAIDPLKDVDGFHPINAGRLATGQKALVPCTPVGCVILAKQAQADLTGLNAVVIGRSNIVGKPVAQLLLQENCTVTVAHSRTQNLPEIVRRADLVVAAAGQCEMVKGEWIKPGAIVIDVGIHRTVNELGKTKLKGDVAYNEVAEVAGFITPVPGGVGPMTIACLLRNSVVACARLNGLPDPVL